MRSPRAWWTVLALLLAIAALQALPASVRALLRYDPQAVAAGQWWRLLSAHAIHLSPMHAALNACGLALCWALADPAWTLRRLVVRMALLGIFIALLLWAFSPRTRDYVGLSGVLYGLIVWILLPAVLVRRERLAALVLAMVLARLAWQSWAGPDAREEQLIGGYIVTQAHWFGVLGGLLGALHTAAAASRRPALDRPPARAGLGATRGARL